LIERKKVGHRSIVSFTSNRSDNFSSLYKRRKDSTMKRLFLGSLTHRNQQSLRISWLAALPLALSLLFISLSSPAFAATHSPATSDLTTTHLSAQAVLTGKIPTMPESASGCVGNLPWNNIQTCFTIIGSGTYVEEMMVSAYVKNSPVKLALQIRGPGFGDYSRFVDVGRGHTVALLAELKRHMPAGKYCGETIVISGSGAGTACETVKA
jgi:hypothetical protein